MENNKNAPLAHEDDSTVITKDQLSGAITEAINSGNDELLKQIITRIHYADLADYINFANFERKAKIISLLDNKVPPEILLEFEIDVLKTLIDIFGEKKFAKLVSLLDIEDIIYLLEDFTESEKEVILKRFPAPKRKEVLEGLSYPKNSAGILMQRSYVTIADANKTVKEVLEYLVGNEKLPEDYDEIFILNKKGMPIGSIQISKLIRAKGNEKIESIMNGDIQVLDSHLDQEEVSYMFRHYDLTSAPVVNKNKKMTGVIYLNQILEVVEEEVEEDILRLGGINITDLYSAFFKTAMQRFPWLFFNLLTACLVSAMIGTFEIQIGQLAILAAIMPVVASMGGNAGTQSVTVAVRAIANKDIITANIKQVVIKEISACALNGALLGVIGGVIIMLLHNNASLSMIFALAVLINFTIAGFFGSLIPIMLNKAGLDPAISSGVFVTFLTDLLGFFIFLALASLLIL